MDLIQANGQPHYGRFSELPKKIDYQAYQYKSPYGEVLSGWRKRLKYKKFKFCSIQHQHYTIGLAIADIAWAGHGFVYIYNHMTGEVQEWNAINFLSRNTVLDEQPLFNQSFFEKSPFQIEIQHANGVRYIRVTKYGEIKLSARIFCAGTDPLSMCSPTGINGWTYTQKLTTLGCEGYFVNKTGQTIQFHERTFASLDDTCGFLRPETAWFWLSCNFWDTENRRVGLNLASGVNESFGNENCLWINGVLYPLTDVLFQPEDDCSWSIRSLDHRLNLTVSTGWRRYENLNLRLVGSQFSQWQAKISGTIQQDDTEIILLNEYGLLEQHYAKW
ncbi:MULTISPECIES: DUF2804 domain-containing protein [Acinetobacter]|uniref:DUF2804 domain-containing protein n=1 Tax=Acinetobacter TaxID=469 RepID=UPI0015B47369|nr:MULTISPECIES: DUF2804 domain-containing protein [Acinetobacter]MBT0886814.1 DUF2804 family protein [Acinetobacter towneri]NWJ92220.1 DUF2804 domain-containing protein [Acinetobacter sp. Swhac1]